MKGYGVVKVNGIPGWLEKDRPTPGYLDVVCEPVVLCPCTSDVHSALDNHMPPGVILGHEAVGRIVEMGAGVKDFAVGDVVAIPAVTPDWRTRDIQDNIHQHSGGMLASMKLSMFMDGVFAEYFLVPDADMNCAKIPGGISLEMAVLCADMISTGFHCAELAQVAFGDTVVIFGAGPVGLMAVTGARLRGAGRIVVVENRKKPVELALAYGASHIVDFQSDSVEQAVLEYNGGRFADAALICGGPGSVMQTAFNVIRPNGIVASVNALNDPAGIVIPAASSGIGCSHKKFIGGLCPGGRVRVERIFRMLQEKRFNPTDMITHKLYGLEKVEDSWHMMYKKTEDLIKPIVYID